MILWGQDWQHMMISRLKIMSNWSEIIVLKIELYFELNANDSQFIS